jgi:hypothetical protein
MMSSYHDATGVERANFRYEALAGQTTGPPMTQRIRWGVLSTAVIGTRK